MANSRVAGHHIIIIAASRPHLCWRMVQILVPLNELLIVIREHVHQDDLAKGGPNADQCVPYMEEFLDFVCGDKTVLESDGWPYS